MNFNLEDRSRPPLPTLNGTHPFCVLLSSLLTNDRGFEPELRSLLGAAEMQQHELGEEIMLYSSELLLSSFRLGEATLDETNSKQVNALQNLYLVCQGRVRLLCRSAETQSYVSAQVIEIGQVFGADHLFWEQPFSYRAIATCPTQIATLPIAILLQCFEQTSELRGQFQAWVQERQRVIFFKTLTSFRRIPSHQLRQFVPHLVEKTVASGISLTTAAPAQQGRFWLLRGKMQASSEEGAVPVVGESWGYPESTPSDWIAQTELKLLKLSAANWTSAVMVLPQLEKLVASDHTAIAPVPSPVVNRSTPPTRLPTLATSHHIPVATSSSASTSDLNSPFPKPAKRRLLDTLGRFPWVEQQSASDCGAACLAMILRYWGKRMPLHVLREQAHVGSSGASLKSLARAAEELGFHTRPVRASLGSLTHLNHPWIAHWQGNHYIVVYRVRGNRVIIADPALGQRSLTSSEFQRDWTGYALLLDPTERLWEVEVRHPSLRRYAEAISPYRSSILQIILFSLLIQVFGLVTPLFTQIILDQVVVQKSFTSLHVFATGLLLFSLWEIGLSSVRQYLLSYLSNRLDLTLISGFIKHALSLPLKFFESRRVGDVITRVQENQKIQRFLVGQMVLSWLEFMTGFVYLGLMLFYNWRMTVLVLSLIPPIVILALAATPFLKHVSRQIFKESANQNSSLVEMFTGIQTVKTAAVEREVRWRWEDQLTQQVNAQFQGQKLAIKLQTVSGLIHSLGTTALLWFGATLVIQDQLTIGQFVAFNMMMGYVISPVINLSNLWDELQEVVISAERLEDVFEAQPECSSYHSLLILPPLQGQVEFEDISFRYGEDEERNTLQNISLTVHSGQTIALVGRSGSGKSTFVKLLQGLYHPTRGRVLIDGHDLRHVAPHSLRSQLGVVPQDCFLFSGTILENITLYRSEFTLDQVLQVAQLAEAHAFIQSLPLGYNTKVGERGSTLSGGQRQRIAIARALLGEPRILILDEATSSLDTESERRFQRNLAQICRDRTTFIIAHRLSTVRNADCILVLDQGIIVEQGTHDELMKFQGLYHHLAMQQLNL
jgi:ATP-binding cassette subfamily B protein